MILVTGATGLVGSHLLAELLPKGEKIRALYRNKAKIEASKRIIISSLGSEAKRLLDNIEWVEADINDIPKLTEAFVDITEVYHCAGLISYDPKDYKKLRKVNIEGTANVVNIALSQDVKKLCHVSSISALGSEIGNKKIKESSPRNNEAEHDNYSISKYGAEMEVWRASQEGLDVVIVNPGVIIGAGNWNSGSGQLFSRIDNGFKYHMTKVTGFVAVKDVSRAMLALMQSNIKNQNFILVGENLSFKTVLYLIAETLNKPLPKKAIQPWMVSVGWITQSVGSFLFGTKKEITKQSIKGIFTASEFDNSKIKEALNFEFTPIEAAIKSTGKIYLEEKQ